MLTWHGYPSKLFSAVPAPLVSSVLRFLSLAIALVCISEFRGGAEVSTVWWDRAGSSWTQLAERRGRFQLAGNWITSHGTVGFMADHPRFACTRHASQLCSVTPRALPVSFLLVLVDVSQEVDENVRRRRPVPSHGPSRAPSQVSPSAQPDLCSHILCPAPRLCGALWLRTVSELQGDCSAWGGRCLLRFIVWKEASVGGEVSLRLFQGSTICGFHPQSAWGFMLGAVSLLSSLDCRVCLHDVLGATRKSEEPASSYFLISPLGLSGWLSTDFRCISDAFLFQEVIYS